MIGHVQFARCVRYVSHNFETKLQPPFKIGGVQKCLCTAKLTVHSCCHDALFLLLSLALSRSFCSFLLLLLVLQVLLVKLYHCTLLSSLCARVCRRHTCLLILMRKRGEDREREGTEQKQERERERERERKQEQEEEREGRESEREGGEGGEGEW